MSDTHYQVAILGAGPGGLSAATNAAHHKLKHILIEKREVGNTVYDYQLRKHVMAEPGRLTLRARVGFEAGRREEVLDVWNKGVQAAGVNLVKGEVTKIEKQGERFQITYSGKQCTADRVVLAIGVQGTPRKLGVPGDDQPHVTYTLSDPDAFTDTDILVVGAGDAAIENALGLCDKNRVSLVNRGDDFARAKDANAALILAAIQSGKIRCFYNSGTASVGPDTAVIATAEGDVTIPCRHIIARIGAIPPRKFMEACGIVFPNSDPLSVPRVSSSYEANVPGLHVIGALIGYPLIKQCMNQGYETIEHIVGNPISPADEPIIAERLNTLTGSVSERLAFLRERLPLFKDLSDPQFRELVSESTLHRAEIGEVLFERNDYTDTFFSVVEGKAAIQLPHGGIVSIPGGEYFGEMGLISGRRRSATVEAGESGIFLESPRKQLVKLMSSVESVKSAIDKTFMLRALETQVFPDIPRTALAELVNRVTSKRLKKGEVVFNEGDIGDSVYVIRRGSVRVSRRNRAGVDVTQTYLAAGNIFGEMALLSEKPQPRSATVTAAVACELIVISHADFQVLLREHTAVAKRIRELAAARRVENVSAPQSAQAGAMREFLVREGVTDADNVLLIDSDLCVGCDNCEQACAATHGGYSRLDRKGGKSFAAIQLPISCRHCENPLCMVDCPPDALIRRPDGEVIIQDSCIGCGNCVRNCPYGVIQLVYDKPPSGFSLLRLFQGEDEKEKGPAKAAKCDLCHHLDGGPACVRACPTGAAMRVNASRAFAIIGQREAR